MISITQTKGTTTATSPIATAATALAANAARVAWGIQNTGTATMFVSLGGTASSTNFNKVLKGGSGASDGLGASWDSDAVCYTGPITVASADLKYVVYELAN